MVSEGRAVVARDIASSIHTRSGFQVFVHYHAIIDRKPGGSGQLSVRGDTYAHCDEISFKFIASARYHSSDAALFPHKTCCSGVGEHCDTLLAQERLDKSARFSVEHQT